MADLRCTYMGLTLRNPVIAGSSGLTSSLEGVARMAEAGAGAVVLKSIFEEEILGDVSRLFAESTVPRDYPEAEEYLERYGREDAMAAHLELIQAAKREVSIPVVASINCVSAEGWIDYARRIQDAGADALELNVFVLPSDPRRTGAMNEKIYLDVAKKVTKAVSIPVALKVGPYFSGLAHTMVELSRTPIRGLVLFNRFVQIDMNIDTFELVPGNLFSAPEEALVPLRWISILYGRVECDLSATTGIHDGAGVIKQLLAGAAAVQVCSALYKKDVRRIEAMLHEVERWMGHHGFESIDDFRGRLCQKRLENPAAYDRVQFMRSTSNVT